jgi:quercetin dioxygenase-like cupin family protein
VNRAHDLRALLAEVSPLAVDRSTTEEQASSAMRPLDTQNGAVVGLVRFTGLTPWERHPHGDELLHVLEGVVEVTVLDERETVRATLRAGSVFIVPRGLWHRQHAEHSVALMFATPVEEGETSWAEDPRG